MHTILNGHPPFFWSTVTSPMLLIFGSAVTMSLIISYSYIQECPHKKIVYSWLSFYYLRLLAFRSWVQLQSSYSIILALCANSRLCYMHFPYEWHKIRNVSCQWMQTTKTVRGSATTAATVWQGFHAPLLPCYMSQWFKKLYSAITFIGNSFLLIFLKQWNTVKRRDR